MEDILNLHTLKVKNNVKLEKINYKSIIIWISAKRD